MTRPWERLLTRMRRIPRIPGAGARPPASADRSGGYAGDHSGPLPPLVYGPRDDGLADPGEVVWAMVPYQEDPARGKDRPVLVIGREAALLLACPMTSKDHDRDDAQERAEGRVWVDVGAGTWDNRRRPSEVGVHRVLRLEPGAVRREGAVLARESFDQVVAALRALHAED